MANRTTSAQNTPRWGQSSQSRAQSDWRSEVNATLVPRPWFHHARSGSPFSAVSANLADGLAIVADIDHNEIIAIDVKDGAVKWRCLTGGRVDSAPTVHKGICLIGDHSGYVSAIKVKSGELIYKLRIAPEEKRMLSYGKVESVWPVIGGVMVADGTAYASAGRTQGGHVGQDQVVVGAAADKFDAAGRKYVG